MNQLFSYADSYIKKCTWKDLALIKFCLCAIGFIVGLNIPKDKRKQSFFIALSVFIFTYIPLMKKFLRENQK